MAELIPAGRRQPLWWTLRRPVRPLTYHAVHRMFERANQKAGTTATLHALRHTAAYRMAEDPALPLTDVQFVLGHALLTTTQIYLTPFRHGAQGTRHRPDQPAQHGGHTLQGPRRPARLPRPALTGRPKQGASLCRAATDSAPIPRQRQRRCGITKRSP